MTEKSIIECDGDWCDPTEEARIEQYETSNEWATFEVDDTVRHLCPECSWRTLQWAVNARSGGDYFAVKHNYVGEQFEEAHIGPGTDIDNVEHAGTQSMWVTPLIDEPPEDYPDFEFGEDEGWHFHVHDHLGLTIIGKHKDEPLVVLEPEEFTTTFEIRETGSGYSYDTLRVEEGIDIERFEVDDDG